MPRLHAVMREWEVNIAFLVGVENVFCAVKKSTRHAPPRLRQTHRRALVGA